MPRSSGGGSHGGGGHSHSSGGGSHGGGGSSQRSSSSYFAGSTKYVYYRHNEPVFFYANYDPTKTPSPLILLFYVPFILVIIMMFSSVIHNPVKLSTDYDTKIVISDGADVIEDEAKLEASLRAFYEKTGITPAVVTIHNEDWVSYYDMETYAYYFYVKSFSDEKHWLIVYSQPEKPKREFNDWYWEGMQGDDTVDILTGSVCDDFNVKLQRYLMSDNFYTVGEAIGTAFDELTPVVMKIKIDRTEIGFKVIFAGFVVVHMVLMCWGIFGNSHKRKAVVCPEGAKEDYCDYCGGIYVVGTCITCPHCNGPLKAHNSYNQETDDFGYGTFAGTVNLNGEEIEL